MHRLPFVNVSITNMVIEIVCMRGGGNWLFTSQQYIHISSDMCIKYRYSMNCDFCPCVVLNLPNVPFHFTLLVCVCARLESKQHICNNWI